MHPREVIAGLQRIVSPEGVEELLRVPLGGVDQWISVRGLHRDNPMILFIHGGPGFPAMPLAWAYQKPWEEYFTVVHWDQRGVGKSRTDDRESLSRSITLERLVLDAEELCDYLLKRFGKRRLVVMGWSFGTVIGTELIRRAADRVSVYVGVAQAAIGFDSERYILRALSRMARAHGGTEELEELLGLEPYPDPDPDIDLKKVLKVRRHVREANGGWYGQRNMDLLLSLPMLAPEYSDEEASDLAAGEAWFRTCLVRNGCGLGGDRLQPGLNYAVPIILMMGRYDLQTPYAKAMEYFNQIQAPRKTFVTFQRAGHFPMFEQPGRFLQCLIELVLPCAEQPAEFLELPDAPPLNCECA
jgi:proline iminopeptidase